MAVILIAEDDRALSEGIKLSLMEEGRSFIQSYLLQEAREALEAQAPDLVILDLNFPDGNGLTLLKECKQRYKKTKVILLTANNMETDIVVGLESGADDYITKPFSLMVLRARVKVQLRTQEESGTTVADEDFFFDFDQMAFQVRGRRLELSRTEQKLLRMLTENRGKTVTREQLIDFVWDGDGEYVDGHALTVSMKRLRDKLEEPAESRHLQTVYGIGYRFV